MIPVIRRVTTQEEATSVNRCDSTFIVESELVLQMSNGHFSYTIRPVSPPYSKRYEPGEYDGASYLARPDRAAWQAYAGENVAGQILVHENWNRFALIWDICVHPPFRRQGLGCRLMEQAIVWAKDKGLRGIMLETQNVNVPACCFYAECGLVLGGVDTQLYQGVMPGTSEIALFWYLLF